MRRYPTTYRKKPGTMNKTEAEYAKVLERMKRNGDIDEYAYEPETLKIGPDCRYTPDFRVMRTYLVGQDQNLAIIEFHEVKGTTRRIVKVNGIERKEDAPFIMEDALVKIKAAANQHPYKFLIVFKGKDGLWKEKEIN
jgi:hypothetical protein